MLDRAAERGGADLSVAGQARRRKTARDRGGAEGPSIYDATVDYMAACVQRIERRPRLQSVYKVGRVFEAWQHVYEDRERAPRIVSARRKAR